MTQTQKEMKEKLLSLGAEEYETIDNCVWFLGRCLLIKEDGSLDEL